MIKINLSTEQLKEAQEKHWEWFKEKQFSRLDKIKNNSNTNDDVKNYFSELFDNEERLKNIVIGLPSSIRNEIQYISSHYSELVNSDEDEKDDDENKIEKELKCIKDQLPTQTSIDDTNWKVEYDKLYKIIAESNYFQVKDIDECKCQTHVKILIKKIADKIKGRKVHDLIASVFSYDTFSDKKNTDWNAYDWVKFLDLKACPYCNRQFIHYYDRKGDEKQMRPALDHFYPKSKYPFLGISLFNLIPSCHVCNSDFKSDKDFFLENHVNPFEESFGDAGKFRTDFVCNPDNTYNIDYLTSVKKCEDFDLSLKIETGNGKLKTKIENSNETFKIEGLYQNHKDYVHEIIKKTHMYNSSKLDELMESFGGQLFDSKEELKQIIMGNYLELDKQGGRVLAKLTQDIFEEFKIDEIWDESMKPKVG